uniref:C-type lectin domain-containing protein n=1 Tax=Denticeps clupeoides TaxID=299321 RepID=A0AAY4ET35_9TELE
ATFLLRVCLLTSSGWHQYQSNCYKLRSHLRKSWVSARTDCLREGGDLVSITSAEEEQYVLGRLDPSYLDIWIGHDMVTEGGYEWSDGSPVSHTNWGHGEPNDHGDREDCVELMLWTSTKPCTSVIRNTPCLLRLPTKRSRPTLSAWYVWAHVCKYSHGQT